MQLYVFTFCLAGLSPFVMLWFKLKNKIQLTPMQVTAWIAGVAGSIFWYFMAPDVRFGFSFILMAGLAPLLLLPLPSKKVVFDKITGFALIVGALYFLWPLYNSHAATKGIRPLVSYLYSPRLLKPQESFPARKIGNTTVYVSNTEFCHEYCFPCVPPGMLELEMRGDKIEDGFRVKK
jgi:hypothetical protein